MEYEYDPPALVELSKWPEIFTSVPLIVAPLISNPILLIGVVDMLDMDAVEYAQPMPLKGILNIQAAPPCNRLCWAVMLVPPEDKLKEKKSPDHVLDEGGGRGALCENA